LGTTFYLMKLKKKIFIYNFSKKMKLFTFIGMQLMTTILIFIIAVLSRSLMSLGYLFFSIILFWGLKDFFYQEKLQRKGKTWLNPFILGTPLLIYCFLDIALQIIYQFPALPGIPYVEGQPTPKERYLGFDKMYRFNSDIANFMMLITGGGYVSFLEFQNLFFFILKAMSLFFIFL